MALTVASTRAPARAVSRTTPAARVCRVAPRQAVRPVAFLDTFKDIMRVFTPGANNVPTKGVTSFSGNTRPHKSSRPFSDEFGARRRTARKAPGSRAAVAEEMAALDAEAEANGLAEYLGGAVQRLMGHNFKGDATEQGKPPAGTGATGWKGRIRHREDGAARKAPKF